MRSSTATKTKDETLSNSYQPRRLARRIPDACAALQISRSHLYELAKEGKIKLVKIGDRTLVPEAELERLANEGA